MTSSPESAKKHIFLTFTLLAAALFFSCRSLPPSETFEGKKAKNSAQEKIISIPVSGVRTRNYFIGIDEAVLSDVEEGSVQSLRRAAAALRKPESEYRENEKVLLYIASSIMEQVWTGEKIDWDVPMVGSETPYAGAISSVKYGIYDTSTGKVDYLATMLPSLVVAKVSDVSPFFAQAEEDLLLCLQSRKESVLLNYLLGLLYKKSGDHSKARNYLSRAFKDSPSTFQCGFEHAEVLRLLGKTKESFSESSSLLEKFPRDVRVLNLNARNAFDLKNYAVAEECVVRILQQTPNDLESLLFRISILVEKKDYIHAASLLDVYSRQDSVSRDYLLLRARVQYDWSKNASAAISTIENALSLYPDDMEIQLFAARLAAASRTKVSGKTSEDMAASVLARDPMNEGAIQYAVEGLVQKGEWKKAYEQSSILAANPSADREWIFLHIKICLAVGRNEEAWNLVSQMYRTDGADENVVQAYITVMQARGMNAQASNLINSLIPESSSRMKSFLYYRRSLMKTREEEVLSDLRSSLIANPRNSDALFRLYEIYYKKKDYRKAQYYLKQVVALNPEDSEMRALNDELSLRLMDSAR